MTHQYSVTVCPACLADLTVAHSVDINAADNLGRVLNGEFTTQLSEDGDLELDGAGIIQAGFHAGTLCGSCGEALDEYEIC